MNNYGYKKFIRLEGDVSFELDEDKIEQTRKWDGLHGVITNLPDMDSVEVLSHYHGLWQVEETFRISKHDLRDTSDPSLDAGAGVRTHRDFVHGADVCATSGLSSPVAVQAAVAGSGAQCVSSDFMLHAT